MASLVCPQVISTDGVLYPPIARALSTSHQDISRKFGISSEFRIEILEKSIQAVTEEH